MKRQNIGWLLAAVSSALVALVLLRRRETVSGHIPDLVEERIVLPIGNLVRNATEIPADETGQTPERMTRKVGRNRKISVYGKLYGPLAPELTGQQVEVEERDGRFIVWAGSSEVGDFEQQP
jgi:hypothetical protein